MGERVPLIDFKDCDATSDSFSESELRIVLVGKSGAGKSATGNTILGRESFKEEASPSAVTNECKRNVADRGGRRIHVVDIPGIFGTLNLEEMKEYIKQCVNMAVPGPHAFLLVMSIGRFTEEEKNAVTWIQDNFGEEAARYTIVLFTHADQLGSKRLEKYIKENDDLQQVIRRCGKRYLAFNNRNKSNDIQVTQLLEKIDAMVKRNGGSYYTNEMFQKAQEEINKKEQAKKLKDVALGAATAVGVRESELRIVLVGKTGAGKSATGNTILGREIFKEESEVCVKSIADHGGRRVHVVDTPGIFGTLNLEEMKEHIQQCVNMAVPGPHAFLLVISIGRFTEEEKNAMTWIQDHFGEEAAHHTIVLFTHTDQLGSKRLEKFINESKDHLQLLSKCGERYLTFNNNNKNNDSQVTQLLEKIDEMVKMNGSYYTNEMFQKAQEETLKKQKLNKVKDVVLGAATAVGVGGVVAGGVVLGVTGAVILPAVGVAAGAALAVGTVAKLIHDVWKKE